jgi:ABC-type lipoprotein release transport system permease subunit
MFLKLAWRNVRRNARRSAIVIASIGVGTVAVIFNDALSIGMVGQIFENQIGSYVADMQVHEAGFNDNRTIGKLMRNPRRVEDDLRASPGVKAFTRRVVTYGLISSAMNSSGVSLVGVDPAAEPTVTTVRKWRMEGRYLGGGRHEVVIGRKLAEKLEAGIGDRLVGMASGLRGNVASEMFRVVGIFTTVSSEFDRSTVFVPIATAQEMLELGGGISEIAVLLDDRSDAAGIRESLASRLGPGYEVLTFAELLPLMIAQMGSYEQSIYIIYIIIGLAMVFGIVNTMLMSVSERVREFGVLMAIGMSGRRLLAMVLVEASLLGLAGALAGVALGVAITLPLSNVGIDLAGFSEGLRAFGAGSVIYPVLRAETLVESLIIIPFFAVLGALYPAVRASRLEPVRAIQHV